MAAIRNKVVSYEGQLNVLTYTTFQGRKITNIANCTNHKVEIADDRARTLLIKGQPHKRFYDDEDCNLFVFESQGSLYIYEVDCNNRVSHHNRVAILEPGKPIRSCQADKLFPPNKVASKTTLNPADPAVLNNAYIRAIRQKIAGYVGDKPFYLMRCMTRLEAQKSNF